MEELDSSSHIVRIFRHDYGVSAKKQMIEKVVCEALILHTRFHGDWNPSGKCHDLLHEGVTLTNGARCKFRLPECLRGRNGRFVLKL